MLKTTLRKLATFTSIATLAPSLYFVAVPPNAVLLDGQGLDTQTTLQYELITPGTPAHGAKVVSAQAPPEDLVIPDAVSFAGSFTDVPVVSIGSTAFSRKGIGSVSLGSNVEHVEHRSFTYNSIRNITFGSKLKAIDEYAFSSNLLTRVDLPAGLTTLGTGAFFYNEISSLTLPSGMTQIPDSAFMSNSLTDVSLPTGLTSIGNGAFHGNLFENIDIPSGVTDIGEDAFSFNRLTHLTLPEHLVSIGNKAFEYNKLEDVQIPDSVVSIGYNAFAENQKPFRAYFNHIAPRVGSYAFGAEGDTLIYSSCAAVGFTTPTWNGWKSGKAPVIVFEGNGGSATADSANADCANPNVLRAKPADPTREGFTFTGWYTSAALTTPFDFSTPVTANTKLYAGWKTAVYTITLTNPDGTTTTRSVDHGTLLPQPETPKREGFKFTGWFYDPAAIGKLSTASLGTTQASGTPEISTTSALVRFDFSKPITHSITLYAGWEAVAVTKPSSPAPEPSPTAKEPSPTPEPVVEQTPESQPPAAQKDVSATRKELADTGMSSNLVGGLVIAGALLAIGSVLVAQRKLRVTAN